MVGSGWHRLMCGVAVFVDEDGVPLQVCDLGTATLAYDEGVFVGDSAFFDVLLDELREEGWVVVPGGWVSTPPELRLALSLELDDDALADRPSSVAEVVQADPSAPSTPPRRAVPGMEAVEVDRYGAFVVQRLPDDTVHTLPLRESGGTLEVDIDGVSWCVDDLVRRAWDDEDEDLGLALDVGRLWS